MTEEGDSVIVARDGSAVVGLLMCTLLSIYSTTSASDYDYTGEYSEGLARVNVGGELCGRGWWGKGRWGYIDRSGDLVIDVKFGSADDFSEGLAWVELDGQTGYIDRSGHMTILLPNREHGCPFSDGLAAVVRNDTWVYINRGGVVALRTEIDRNHIARRFSEGLAAVYTGGHQDSNGDLFFGGKWGYINKRGQFAIPPRFDWAYDFQNGEAVVSVGCEHNRLAAELTADGGEWGTIDKCGKWMQKPTPEGPTVTTSDRGTVECQHCDGVGYYDCDRCHGKGSIEAGYECPAGCPIPARYYSVGSPCPKCDRPLRRKYVDCPSCDHGRVCCFQCGGAGQVKKQ